MRTLRNLRKIGIRDYAHQMMYIGDTKAGTFIAADRYGNKYYENLQDELPRKFGLGSSHPRLLLTWTSSHPLGRLPRPGIQPVRCIALWLGIRSKLTQTPQRSD